MGSARIYRLPDLSPGVTVEAEDVDVEAPEAVTDATFTHAGSGHCCAPNDELWVYDPTTWDAVGKVETPKLEQGESVTVERGDRTMLLGSEGENSPIVRVSLPAEPAPAQPVPAQPDNTGNAD